MNYEFKNVKRITYNVKHKTYNVKPKIFILIVVAVTLISCRNTSRDSDHFSGENLNFETKYACGFRVEHYPDYIRVFVRDPWDTSRVLRRYVLVSKSAPVPDSLPEGILIRTPLKRVASYSSVQCGILNELNLLPVIVGVCEPQYVDIPAIQEGIRQGKIADLGMAGNPNIEKIMMIEPEAILTTPLDNSGYGSVEKTTIPLIECTDYMESSPLGRAEWIRFHSLFYETESRGDSLFRVIENSYNRLKELAETVKSRPTVFTEMKYGNVWHVSGGRSYVARLLKDAGADYCWADDFSAGSMALSLETVLKKAEHADYWLVKYNSSRNMTYKDLAGENQLYQLFDAFKKRKVYSCNTGKVPYYEELPVHPEYVLKDLIWIFHPELLTDYQPRYYERVE